MPGMNTWVYDFADGDRDQKDLLGGKGANLAEMSNLGLPVPPGFTITTEACRAYLEHGDEPDGLADQVTTHLASLEEAMGRRLGDPDDPLLVSVRSGAKFSMPSRPPRASRGCPRRGQPAARAKRRPSARTSSASSGSSPASKSASSSASQSARSFAESEPTFA